MLLFSYVLAANAKYFIIILLLIIMIIIIITRNVLATHQSSFCFSVLMVP